MPVYTSKDPYSPNYMGDLAMFAEHTGMTVQEASGYVGKIKENKNF